MTLRPRHDLSVEAIARLEDQLYAFNRAVTGQHDGRDLAFEALDAAGAPVGAIAGYSWAGMAEIRQLFVDPRHRGAVIGRALVEAAVAEAAARGCHLVWVTTHSFQAPGLYERCGFVRMAEFADWPPDHSKIVLQRRLGRAGV